MSKTKEWFMDEEERKAEELNKDLYWEHEMHHQYTEHCSTCYSENRLIQAKNTVDKLPSTVRQDSALSKLRASIDAQREQRAVVFQSTLPLPPSLEIKTVPLITIESATEFNPERYEQLCTKVDALFHNYLYWKEKSISIFDVNNTVEENEVKNITGGFEQSMRELTDCFENLISEGVKIRFS